MVGPLYIKTIFWKLRTTRTAAGVPSPDWAPASRRCTVCLFTIHKNKIWKWTQHAYGSRPTTRQSRARPVLVCAIALCCCRAKPAIVDSWARPRATGNCHTNAELILIFHFYVQWTNIQCGADRLEPNPGSGQYLAVRAVRNFQKNCFHVHGTDHSAPTGWSPN
jgi:hypothetical protein